MFCYFLWTFAFNPFFLNLRFSISFNFDTVCVHIMLMLPDFPIELEFIDLILSYAVQFMTLL